MSSVPAQGGGILQRSTPALILLEINTPILSGKQVLDEIVQGPGLNNLPVVVFTSSAYEREILEAYKLGCRCYVVKPLELEQFSLVIRSVTEYWLKLVVIPTAHKELA